MVACFTEPTDLPMTNSSPSLADLQPALVAGPRTLRFRPNQYLAHVQMQPDKLYVLRRGWAIRYRQLRDGRRQITGLFLQGDCCDIGWLGQSPLTQSFKAVTDVEATAISVAWLMRRTSQAGAEQLAIANEVGLQAAMAAEQALTLGRKTAAERLAQLFSEIWWRTQAGSASPLSECPMPLTQQDMADLLGLTPIHVNRVLRELRDAGIVTVKARRMIVPDLGRLQRLAQFDPRYLHGLAKRRATHLLEQ